MKNYFRGSSMEKRLGNTGLENDNKNLVRYDTAPRISLTHCIEMRDEPHAQTAFLPGKRVPGAHKAKGKMGPRFGLDVEV
jgi:hypothetical protein